MNPEPVIYDLAIIGGGPAGAAAAVYAARKRLRAVMITRDWLGQSNTSLQIENWIGTVAISGLDLSKALESHAKTYGDKTIDFKEGERCERISRTKNGQFIIKTDKNAYETRSVLITSGSSRRRLDVPGAEEYEHKGLTYCATCDGPLYADQDVAVVGGGNAGFESAAQLLAYARSVTLLARSHFRADPSTVEKVLAHPHMKAVEHATLKEIKGDKFVTSLVYADRDGRDTTIPVSGIFAEIGTIPNTDFARDILDLDEVGRIKIDARNQRSSLQGIWAAGDCTDGLYHQNNIAAGDAVKAIEDIYLWLRAR